MADTSAQLTPPPPSPQKSRWRRRRRRIVAVVAAIAALVAYANAKNVSISATVDFVRGASLVWLLAALAATVGSMVAFAALRHQSLRVAGSPIPFTGTLATGYVAGAVHATVPAGAVFSASYSFRALRRLGAASAAVTWSLAITGALSGVALSAVAITGVALDDVASSVLGTAAKALLGIGVLIGLVHLLQTPTLLLWAGHQSILLFNKLTGRPRVSGQRRLDEIAASLAAIRPRTRDWLGSLGWATCNWLLDLLCLMACCAAVGLDIDVSTLILAFTAGMAASSLIPLPLGGGAVETAMILALTVGGAAASPAFAAVVLYRLLSSGTVIATGWLIFFLQKDRPPLREAHPPNPR